MLCSVLVIALALAEFPIAHTWNIVPRADSIIVQEHARARAALASLERGQRQDQPFRETLSAVAKKADAIVQAIRNDDLETIWRVNSTCNPDGHGRFAGQLFPLARPCILGTKLWKIVKRFPKGALLHTHLTAMLPYDILLETVLHTEGMSVSASQSLATEEGRRNASITFSHHNTTIPKGPSIDSISYVPNTAVEIREAARGFAGGEAAFLEYLKSKMVIPSEESIRHERGVDDIWRQFQAVFYPIRSLVSYEPVVRTFYQNMFLLLVDDGISWVEIRAGGPSGMLVHKGEESLDPDLDFWWQVMEEEMAKFKVTEKGKHFWGARVIWSDYRGKDQASLLESMKTALERKLKFPELFSGYDVIGREELGRTLADMAPELLWFQEQAADLNISLPFFFHAGETLGDGDATDRNLFDALLLRTRRIGHGFSLYKHPELMKKVIESGVLVEVCPISNEVLRLTSDILHHPLPAMIAHGIPTAISSDDPAILGQDAVGVSYDFYQVIQAFENVGLAGLGALAHNSIRWSNFEDQSDEEWIRDIQLAGSGNGLKAKRIRAWNQQWEDFCEWIVREFGSNDDLFEEQLKNQGVLSDKNQHALDLR